MPESIDARYLRWGVEGLLLGYPDLRIIPSGDGALKIGGELRLRVRGPSGETIEDAYRVELRIPAGFPAAVPAVSETGGRIPKTYHKLEDGSLCLAAPTELRLKLGQTSTLREFVETFVVPYLYGYSFFEKHGTLPYGELEHGKDGLRQHLASLFGARDRAAALEFARLTSLRKRVANKELCPCGSGRRLGRCHHLTVNELRARLGRQWFKSEYEYLYSSRIGSAPSSVAPLVKRPGLRRRKGLAR